MNPLLTTDWHGKAEQARAQQKMHELQRRLGNNPKDSAKLKKACEDFESLFMAKIWQQMRATVPRELLAQRSPAHSSEIANFSSFRYAPRNQLPTTPPFTCSTMRRAWRTIRPMLV